MQKRNGESSLKEVWLNKKVPIYLYGFSQQALTRGKYQIMRQLGYNVRGYIDINARTLKRITHIPVFSMEEIPESKEERKEVQVIILLQRVILHNAVKKQLEEMGFQKILYMPLSVKEKKDKELMEIYECFLENDFEQVGKYCTIGVDVRHIFTFEGFPMGRVCITDNRLYLSIIEKCFGKDVNIDDYCKLLKVERESLIEDRKSLFQFLKEKYENEKELFYYNAPHVMWRKDSIVVVDGLHRATFLVYMGEQVIYLRMKKEDALKYNTWKIKNACEKG